MQICMKLQKTPQHDSEALRWIQISNRNEFTSEELPWSVDTLTKAKWIHTILSCFWPTANCLDGADIRGNREIVTFQRSGSCHFNCVAHTQSRVALLCITLWLGHKLFAVTQQQVASFGNFGISKMFTVCPEWQNVYLKHNQRFHAIFPQTAPHRSGPLLREKGSLHK